MSTGIECLQGSNMVLSYNKVKQGHVVKLHRLGPETGVANNEKVLKIFTQFYNMFKQEQDEEVSGFIFAHRIYFPIYMTPYLLSSLELEITDLMQIGSNQNHDKILVNSGKISYVNPIVASWLKSVLSLEQSDYQTGDLILPEH